VFDNRRNPLVPSQPQARLIQADFADARSLQAALQGAEIAFHLVGTTVPQTSIADPLFDIRSNVIPSIVFLHACTRSGVRKVVFLSSGGTVYGVPRQVPIPEMHPTDPISSYGITKLMVEKYLGLFHRLHGLDYAVLRCSNAYGPRQDPLGKQGAIAVFLGRLAGDTPVVIWGDGRVVRDHVYVLDIARAAELAAAAPVQERVLNIGSGVGISLSQLLEVMQEVTGRAPRIEYRDPRGFDVPINVLDISLARHALGWEPGFDLRSGLERTWEWIQRWAATSGHPAATPQVAGR
jgi:UDP-glucose 4-epimerase